MAASFQWKQHFAKTPTQQHELGRWLKEELVALGPAFIKMGQFVSTRNDVFSKEIGAELKNLQDNIPPTTFPELQTVLFEEYGSLYDSIFLQFDPEPIASASIGQVHRAVLKKERCPVVVKIQKPHVGDQIRTDLDILKTLCRFGLQWNSGRASELQSLLHQYEEFLGGELDYLTEQDQMLFFKEQLEPVMPVVIPRPYPEYSTQRVLVMEDVPSTKITDLLEHPTAQTISGEELVEMLVDVFLYQIIYCGRVHCDPHPGNIGVDASGQLVLYDFGNVANLGEAFRANVRQLVVAVYQKDVDEFLELLLTMQILQIRQPMERLELKNFFMYLFEYLEEVDFQKLRSSILENDVLKNSNLKVKIQPQFLSLFRVFSLLDGTCTKLNPNFSYLPSLQPYFEEVLRDLDFMGSRMQRDFQKITAFPKMLQNAENNIVQINRQMTQMTQQSQMLQWMMALYIVLEHLDNPVRLMGFIPLMVMAAQMMK